MPHFPKKEHFLSPDTRYPLFVFGKIWRALLFCNNHFEICHFTLLPTYYCLHFVWQKHVTDDVFIFITWLMSKSRIKKACFKRNCKVNMMLYKQFYLGKAISCLHFSFILCEEFQFIAKQRNLLSKIFWMKRFHILYFELGYMKIN